MIIVLHDHYSSSSVIFMIMVLHDHDFVSTSIILHDQSI